MDRDRNLLFGILAVQLGKVSPAQLVEVAGAWAADRAQDLSNRMVDAALITEDERRTLLGLIDYAVQTCGGDSSATLEAFGGEQGVFTCFAGSIVVNESGDVEAHPPNLSVAETLAARPAWGAEGRTADAETVVDSSELPSKGVEECPGRYSVVRDHARGGMGRILHVTDHHLEREIALKELLPEFPLFRTKGTDVPNRIFTPRAARFLQEARITGQLEHPAIVPVYELGHRADGTLYYTMKLVRGKTLAAAVSEAESLWDRLAHLAHFTDLCQAVAYAHTRGVIHRDIKPENVMVGEFGETVVIDWGLAKARGESDIHLREMEESIASLRMADSSVPNTRYGSVLGTPSYMPPEQARGDIDAIDERSDVYSLGAVLYNLLTGQLPFKGSSLRDITKKVIGEEPTPIASIVPDAPPELAAICERAMQKDPDARYQSARELAAEIERFQSGSLVRAYEYKFTEHLRRFAKRHKAILTTAAAALLLIVGLAAFYQFRLVESRDRAQENFRQARRENYYHQIALAAKDIDELRFEEAKDLLTKCPEQYRHFEWGLLQHFCNLGIMTLTAPSQGPIASLAISADGTQLFVADGALKLKRWNLTTGEELPGIGEGVGPVACVTISKDGKSAAFSSEQNAACVWDLQTGARSANLEGHGGTINAIAFSADGRRLATGSSDGVAILWDAHSGRVLQELRGHLNDVTAVAFSTDGRFVATGSRDDTAALWNAASGERVAVFAGHTNDVTAVAFDLDGRRLASASLDKTIRFWDVASGKEQERFKETTGVNAIAFSPDGRLLATATEGNMASIWDVAKGEVIRRLKGHSRSVAALAFDPHGQFLITGGEDRLIKLWETMSEAQYVRMRVAPQGPNFVKFAVSGDGSKLVAAGNYGAAMLWDLEQNRLLRTIDCETVDFMELSADGSRLMTLRSDGTLAVWELEGGGQLVAVKEPFWYSAALSPDGNLLVVGRMDGKVVVRNVDTDEVTATLSGHAANVSSMAFDAKCTVLATVDESGTILVWDLGLSTESRRLQTAPGVRALAFSPDGAKLVSVGNALSVWEWRAPQPFQTLAGMTRPAVAVVFSSDGRRMATGSEDGMIELWDAETARELVLLSADTGYVEALAFAEDNTSLIAVGEGRKAADTFVAWKVPSWTTAMGTDKMPLDNAQNAAENRIEAAKRDYWRKKRSATPLGTQLAAEVAKIAARGDQLAEGTGAKTHPAEIQVDGETLTGLLQVAVAQLKQNRDARGYRGRPFVSEGMYLEEGAAIGPLRELGLRGGDIISRINDTTMSSYDNAIEVLNRMLTESAQGATIEFWRNGVEHTLVLRTGPADSSGLVGE